MPRVYFVGCGPGAADLITVRAKKIIEQAETVVYSGSLIPQEILDICGNARLHDASGLVREEITNLLRDSAREEKLTVRLHDGDPVIYGAVREQVDNLAKLGIESVLVPGVTSFLAAACELGVQLTLPGVTQTMIITRAEKRTKVPERESIANLAMHRSTMIFYLSVHLLRDIVQECTGAGYPKSTPAAVVYRASWDDQRIIRGTLEDIEKKTRDARITRTAIIIIGDVIEPESYEYSRLYDKTFSHGFRSASD